MELNDWIASLPGSPTVSQAADHAGVSKATLLRHAKKGETTAEYAVAISRAYDVNEIGALVTLGIVTDDAVDKYGIIRALQQATNQQLLDEIVRRSDPEARYLFGEDEDTIGLAPDAQVLEFPVADVDRLDDDEMPEAAVAYSGPDEDQLRQEDDGD